MSERKFNDKSNGNAEEYESSVSGVEVYRCPKWQRFLGIAAAFAVAVGGITGGAIALKHYRSTSNIATDSEVLTKKKVAPFGDFAEIGYQLCDNSREPLFWVERSQQSYAGSEGEIEFDTVEVYGGIEIPQDKRCKLADFFNSYDYGECRYEVSYDEQIQDIVVAANGNAQTIQEYAETVVQETKDAEKEKTPAVYENLAGTENRSDTPYFIYNENGEIREISIYSINGVGYLSYEEYRYEEKDGVYTFIDDSFLAQMWNIDYDLFKSAINEILGSDEETADIEETSAEAPAEPVAYPDDGGVYPFRGFAEKDYWINNSFKGDTDQLPLVNVQFDESGQIHSARPRPALDPGKRRELEEFFAGLEWKEGYADKDEPEPWFVYNNDDISFDMLTDTEFSRIVLNLCTNVLTVDTMPVTKEPGGDEYFMKYICSDYSKREMKRYSTDCPDMKDKLMEILGNDFGSLNLFVDLDWEYSSDEMGNARRKLTDEEKQAVFDILGGYGWKAVDTDENGDYLIDPFKGGSDHDYVLLTWYGGYSCNLISIECLNGRTYIATYDAVLEDGKPVGSASIRTTTEYDDDTILQQIKDRLGS